MSPAGRGIRPQYDGAQRADTLYQLRWKRRKAPPIDYIVCDAYDGHELYVTSDQADAHAERKRLNKTRHVKLLALVYQDVYQAVFDHEPKRPERCIGWRRVRTARTTNDGSVVRE